MKSALAIIEKSPTVCDEPRNPNWWSLL